MFNKIILLVVASMPLALTASAALENSVAQDLSASRVALHCVITAQDAVLKQQAKEFKALRLQNLKQKLQRECSKIGTKKRKTNYLLNVWREDVNRKVSDARQDHVQDYARIIGLRHKKIRELTTQLDEQKKEAEKAAEERDLELGMHVLGLDKKIKNLKTQLQDTRRRMVAERWMRLAQKVAKKERDLEVAVIVQDLRDEKKEMEEYAIQRGFKIDELEEQLKQKAKEKDERDDRILTIMGLKDRKIRILKKAIDDFRAAIKRDEVECVHGMLNNQAELAGYGIHARNLVQELNRIENLV